MSRAKTVITLTAIATLTLAVGYAAYFDYKRRNDAAFRKRLRKDQKRAHRTATSETTDVADGPSKEDLREALQKVKDETIPDSADAKEQYFMQNISVGEQLCAQGEAFYLPAALSFYRALRVYPAPVELIIIYQKTVPEPVFKIVMEMTSLDTQSRIEGYYDHFPPKHMNVSVTQVVVDTGGQATRKNVLVASKDIQEGEEIYAEDPVIAALDPDLESGESNCSYCLREIDSALSLKLTDDPLHTVYCSKDCQTKARMESHGILFGLEPPLMNDRSSTQIPAHAQRVRQQAQEDFVASLRSNENVLPLLVARFIGRQVAAEMAKIGINRTGAPLASGSDGISDEMYGLADHVERLRYLDLPAQEEESKLVSRLLETAMPGLEQTIHDEKYTILKGKVAYNMIGICYADGRSNKPTPKCRPESAEKTRTPHGTDRQIGCGLYMVSSYISHSCRPSVRPSFTDGTSCLHLIANHSLKKGDEITMAYVDVLQRSDETVSEARLRRRKELARGWRFTCMCPRCMEEAPHSTVAEDSEKAGDESKVEAVYRKYERKETAE